jgi:hypothetical protein
VEIILQLQSLMNYVLDVAVRQHIGPNGPTDWWIVKFSKTQMDLPIGAVLYNTDYL